MALKGRELRHKRIRKKISGTKAKPRFCVRRSLKHMYAQLVDDVKKITLFSLSTNSSEVRSKAKYCGNIKAADLLGQLFAANALKKGYSSVVFDRSGYKYHGRVKALADACRKNGLKF